MAKKKPETQETITAETPEEKPSKKMLKLLIGVNYKIASDQDEQRVEAGLIEEGTLPPAFENLLKEKKQLIEV